MNGILELVNKVCVQVRDSNKTAVTFKTLLANVRRGFKKEGFDLKIKTKKDSSLDSSEFYVHAFYDAHDDYHNETPIEIFINHNFTNESQFSSSQITEFLIQIFDAVVHEYRHQKQSQQRNYETYSSHEQTPYHVYLADPDEVDAYSFSIAIELLRGIGGQRSKRNLSRISVLSKMRSGAQFVSPNLNAYISHFGTNKLIKRLAKKVYKHLDEIDSKHVFK